MNSASILETLLERKLNEKSKGFMQIIISCRTCNGNSFVIWLTFISYKNVNDHCDHVVLNFNFKIYKKNKYYHPNNFSCKYSTLTKNFLFSESHCKQPFMQRYIKTHKQSTDLLFHICFKNQIHVYMHDDESRKCIFPFANSKNRFYFIAYYHRY